MSNILFEFGDPMGPEITFPPFALAKLAGVVAEGFGDEELPLTAELRDDGIFAEALGSFLAIAGFRFALSNESPRLGKFCNCDARLFGFGESLFVL